MVFNGSTDKTPIGELEDEVRTGWRSSANYTTMIYSERKQNNILTTYHEIQQYWDVCMMACGGGVVQTQ